MSIKNELIKKNYPEILVMDDGTPVTRDKWAQRRKELRVLLEEHSYGKTPPADLTTFNKIAAAS